LDQIEIARAVASDLHTLRELGMQTFIEAFAADNTEEDMSKYLSEKFSQERISEELNNPDSHFFYCQVPR